MYFEAESRDFRSELINRLHEYRRAPFRILERYLQLSDTWIIPKYLLQPNGMWKCTLIWKSGNSENIQVEATAPRKKQSFKEAKMKLLDIIYQEDILYDSSKLEYRYVKNEEFRKKVDANPTKYVHVFEIW